MVIIPIKSQSENQNFKFLQVEISLKGGSGRLILMTLIGGRISLMNWILSSVLRDTYFLNWENIFPILPKNVILHNLIHYLEE